jgi:glycosidase
MRLYGRGIRRRLATMLGGDRRRLELVDSLLFTLPGTPVWRYGNDIGMGDDLSLLGRQRRGRGYGMSLVMPPAASAGRHSARGRRY